MNIAYNYIIFYLRSETENMKRPADKFLENFINIHNVSQCTFNDVNMLYSMYLQSLISSKVLFLDGSPEYISRIQADIYIRL